MATNRAGSNSAPWQLEDLEDLEDCFLGAGDFEVVVVVGWHSGIVWLSLKSGYCFDRQRPLGFCLFAEGHCCLSGLGALFC